MKNVLRFNPFFMRILLLGLFIPLFFIRPALGQQFPMRHYTSDEGLLCNEVLTVFQDSRLGYLWFGTCEGISRFDGKRFKNYTEKNSGLGGTVIRDITEDSQHNLWVAYTGGIARLKGERFVNYTDKDGLPGTDVINLWAEPQKGLWILTEQGVSYFNGDQFVSYPLEGVNLSLFAPRLAGSPRGDIFAVTDSGLFHKKPDEFEFKKDPAVSFPIQAVRYDSRKDVLYLISPGTLWERSASGTLTPVAESPLNSDLMNFYMKDSILWLCSQNGKIWRRTPKGDHVWHHNMLGNGNLTHLMADREGNLWLASRSGVSMVLSPNILNYTGTDLPLNIVTRILRDTEGNLWISGDSGIVKMSRDCRILLTRSMPFVEDIFLDEKKIFACLYEKLSVYDLQGNLLRDNCAQEKKHYTCMIKDRRGKYWVGTYSGLYSIENDRMQPELNTSGGLGSNAVRTLLADTNGILWAGTDNGLSCRYNGSWFHFDKSDGLPHNSVRHLYEDKDRGILAATGQGIVKAEPFFGSEPGREGFKVRFELLPILSDVPVSSLCTDTRGNLLAGTSDGLFRIGNGGTVNLSLDKSKGLPGNTVYFRSLFADSDYIYIGTYRGMSRIETEIENNRKINPLLDLYEVRVNQKVRDISSLSGPLAHTENNLTFFFNAIYTYLPNHVLYSYFLKGMDDRWSAQSPLNQAVYTNLPAGNYIFQVQAHAEDGKQSEIQTVRFTIEKPFWQAWWVYSLAGLFGLALFMLTVQGVSRQRLRKNEEYARVLEQEVNERTSKLESQKSLLEDTLQELKIAKKDVESANRIRSEFLARVSDEIRTPMSVILGMADMLRETPLNPRQKEYVQIFSNAGENLLILFNSILDLSKIEMGQLELEETEFNLYQVIQKTCDIMIYKADEKGLMLRCQVSEDIKSGTCLIPGDHFVGDPVRLRQILVHLIGNAIKFTEQGEIIVEVSCLEPVFPNRPFESADILFLVKDTGIGIPSEKQKAILENHPPSDLITREHGGPGFGLIICKRLTEMMGGQIWVESAPGDGSTFFFTSCFKVAYAEEDDLVRSCKPRQNALTDEAPDALSRDDYKKGQPLRILLVEDNKEYQMIFEFYLKDIPHQFDIAENGRIGLKKYMSGKYDVIFMDIEMPVMGGYETAKRIRTWEKENSADPVTIIALTAHTMKRDREKCFEAGMDDYISKPLDPDQLSAVLARHRKN
jgi:signal transduction histidine kinase/ligand-binding sensor domain-containing protein/CheY-like chemotaxis protein